MNKTFVSLLIGVFAVLILTGCGGGNTAPVGNAGPDQNYVWPVRGVI